MIILNMQEKQLFVKIPITAFSLETNVVKLELKMLNGDADYSLEGKTVTAKFSKTGLETEPLTIADGIIQLPITNDLLKNGENHIQLIFYWGAIREESPIMTWLILDSIKTTGLEQHAVDVASWLITTMANVEKEEENRVAAENARVVTENEIIAAEGSRVNAESGRAQAETERGLNIASLTADLIRKNKKEMSKYFNQNWLDSDSSYSTNGAPVVSNPDSLIYVNSLGDNGGRPVIFDTIGSKGGYSPGAGGSMNGIITEFNDYAYYPYYLNRPYASENRPASARWKLVGNEYPSGILEYSYAESDKTAHAKCFVKGEVAYTVFDLSGINDMRFSTSLKSIDGERNFTGGYEEVEGKKFIAVKDNTTGLWFAITCSDMQKYVVRTENVSAIYGFENNESSVANSACVLGLGCGAISGGRGKIVFCVSIGMSKELAVNRVLAGVDNWREKLIESKEDWAEFYSDLGDDLTHLTVEQKAKYYTCAQQIRSLNYKGYMSAGAINWTKNFIRDSAWTMYALCHTNHQASYDLAKSMMDWYSGVDSFVHSNAYTVDQKRCESSMNQTDTASTFMLAVAKMCEIMDYDATGVKFILDQCLSYVEQYFSIVDNHVSALHAHDFWDDYVEEIDATIVRYESMVDVLWIVALEAIKPVFESLGDTTRANYCATIAVALRNHLEDYRRADGSLDYAIKIDGSLYTSIEALPGTLYCAWLMGDARCKNWIMNHGEALRIKGGFSHYPLTHSNALAATLDYGAWVPYIPIVAMIAHEHGDDSLINDLSASFPFGGLVEYATISKSNTFIHSSHAMTFPWAEAMYLIMANQIL